MKRFYINHNGLIYGVHEYANSKREAISNYRKRWKLEYKHINLVCWEC